MTASDRHCLVVTRRRACGSRIRSTVRAPELVALREDVATLLGCVRRPHRWIVRVVFPLADLLCVLPGVCAWSPARAPPPLTARGEDGPTRRAELLRAQPQPAPSRRTTHDDTSGNTQQETRTHSGVHRVAPAGPLLPSSHSLSLSRCAQFSILSPRASGLQRDWSRDRIHRQDAV
jgi:hypothetical protein